VFVALGTALYGYKVEFEQSKPVMWVGLILYAFPFSFSFSLFSYQKSDTSYSPHSKQYTPTLSNGTPSLSVNAKRFLNELVFFSSNLHFLIIHPLSDSHRTNHPIIYNRLQTTIFLFLFLIIIDSNTTCLLPQPHIRPLHKRR
jgi:Microsomal signal peptidase 25 kDa subunit (SPC25)